MSISPQLVLTYCARPSVGSRTRSGVLHDESSATERRVSGPIMASSARYA